MTEHQPSKRTLNQQKIGGSASCEKCDRPTWACACPPATTNRTMSTAAIESALTVLAWLHESTADGARRDEISRVRDLLWELLDR